MKIAMIIMTACFVLAAALAGYVLYRMKKDQKLQFAPMAKRGGGSKNRMYFLYKIFSRTPILKRYFFKTRAKVETLYPADLIEVNRRTTSIMARNSVIGILCAVILVVLARGDIFYMMVSAMTVYIVITNSMSQAINKMETDLLRQFSDFLTSVRANYRTTKQVEDSIYMTLDDLPHEIALHANRLYEIVTSTDMAGEVEKYTDVAPNRFLEMFASTCATITEYGDRETEEGSVFLTNINLIKQETYVEITKRDKNKYLFSGTVFLTVLPIFGIKLIALWASSITDLSTFYEGTMGTIVTIIIFASVFICYELISNMRDGLQQSVKEHPLLEGVAKLPVIRSWLTKAVDLNYTKALRIDDNLKMVGDHITPQAYLAQRLIWGIGLGFFTFFFVLVAHIGGKMEILHDFSSAYEDSVVPDEQYRENLRTFSEAYMQDTKMMRSMTDAEEKELSQKIRTEQGVTETIADEAAHEIRGRVDRYAGSYFKFWYLLIVGGAAVGGYYVPIAFLRYRMSIMKMSMEDEVAQFQALALILMNVEGMTLDVILEWMERFAFCFRESISECIINLQMSEEAALKKMRDTESFPPFKRFCENLLAIDNVGVVSAFDEIKTEQAYYKEQRALNNEIMMTRKSNLAKDMSRIPFGITVAGYLLYPFISYAFRMLGQFRTALNF